MNFKINRVMLGDSYKYSHTNQYPDNTVSMFDYAEARSGKVYPKTLFNGLQPILMKYFSTPIEQWEVDEAYKFSVVHGVSFNKEGWDYIVQHLGGYLPVKIRAVAEGTVVPVQNVLFTVESTDSYVYWITSWLETVLMTVWYPCNVATRSYYVRKLLENYAEETQDNPFVDYSFHNFGARGSSNPETAMMGGIAHLAAGFLGTDNFSALKGAEYYYGVEDISTIGHSINASEHSSTCAWGKDEEMNMIMNHLEKNEGRYMIAAVMDSYDYYKAVENICEKDGMFQKRINLPEYPIFVMRPDSGDPEVVIPKTLDIMEKEEVPYTVNKKGFKVFNKMRIIWGDGINMESMETMLKIMMDRGYSTENIAFGSGGWLMQQHDRDLQSWAIKCSEITLDEGTPVDCDDGSCVWEPFYVTRDVFKDPITAPNKKSKKGKITLWYNHQSKEFFTDKVDFKTNVFPVTDMLNTVFENGKMIKTYTLEEVRKNSKNKV